MINILMLSNVNENSHAIKIEEEQQENEPEPLYVMTVELEKGKSESIKIYPESKPEELSYEFCKKYNLDFTSLNYLTSQIKTLLENSNVNSNNNQAPTGDVSLNTSGECIIEVDEEDILTSDARNNNNNPSQSALDSNNNPNPNPNNIINSTDNKHIDESLSSNHIINKAEESLNQRQNNENLPLITQTNIKETNGPIAEISTHSIFSYNDVYNRFKTKIETKQKSVVNSNITNNNNKSSLFPYKTRTPIYNNNMTSIYPKTISLAENEHNLKAFLSQQSKHLDDIYQKRIHGNDIFSSIIPTISNGNNMTIMTTNHNNKETLPTENNKEKNNCSLSKSHTNSINDNKVCRIEKNAGNEHMVPKSASSHLINRSRKEMNNAIGERLYKEGMLRKGETKQKLWLIKQKLIETTDAENTFYPKTNTNKNNIIPTKKKANANQNNIPFSNRRILIGNKTTKPSLNDISYTEKYKINSSQQGNQPQNPKKSLKNTNKLSNDFSLTDIQSSDCSNELSKLDIFYNKKKEETFRNIFHILNPSQSVIVNFTTIDRKRLPLTIYTIIKPIITEISLSKEDLNIASFISSCFQLFNYISFEERRQLLDYNKQLSQIKAYD